MPLASLALALPGEQAAAALYADEEAPNGRVRRRGRPFGRLAGAIMVFGAVLVVVGAGLWLSAPPDMGPGSVVLPTGSPGTMPPLLSEFPSLSPGLAAASASPSADPPAAPSASPVAAPTPAPVAHSATRIVMTRARIDLPVITAPIGEKFPYCDVAERMAYYDEPGAGGVTYLYAHATHYMFGGLLAASWQPDSYLLGAQIQIYTSDDLVYTYAVTEIHRNVPWTSFALVNALVGEALVLQACENNDATGPKLLVVARPVSVATAVHAAAHPPTAPRVCAHGY